MKNFDKGIITGRSSYSTNELTEDMLNEVISYLQKLNLIVNTSKTSVMLFAARAGGYIPDVNVNGCRIPNVTTTKFLGVYIDSNLTWESHFSELCGKLRKNVFLLRQLSQTVDKTTLIQCYYAFINSILCYGNLVWGGAVATHINKVFSLQKSAVRIIENLSSRQTCRSSFKKLKLLTFPSIYISLSILYVVENLSEITLNNDIHDYNTKRNTDIHLNLFKSNYCMNNPLHKGSFFFNKLPDNLKILRYNPKKLKRELKMYLIDRELYDINEL